MTYMIDLETDWSLTEIQSDVFRGFILALFQSTTAYKFDSEHTRGNKRLLPVCEAEIL